MKVTTRLIHRTPVSSCSNVDNTTGSVHTIHAQNFSHGAAGPIFWNNYHDLSDCDNFALPGRSSGTRNCKSDKPYHPCPHVERTRRPIHNRRFRGLSVSDSMRQGGLLQHHGRLPATQMVCGSKPQYSWTDASFEASQR